LPAAAIVSEIVPELHGLGAKLVATRVEDASTHAHCLSAGVDLVQGFYYDRPAEDS
jgi:EAL domain-containing protein (putative c-di-GMP-specific phosphodiesterase class I)